MEKELKDFFNELDKMVADSCAQAHDIRKALSNDPLRDIQTEELLKELNRRGYRSEKVDHSKIISQVLCEKVRVHGVKAAGYRVRREEDGSYTTMLGVYSDDKCFSEMFKNSVVDTLRERLGEGVRVRLCHCMLERMPEDKEEE